MTIPAASEDDKNAGATVAAVGLGAIAVCVEIGSAIAYASSVPKGQVDLAGFLGAHPFDLLSVAVWYSAGNWLARHIKSRLSVVVLSFGLAVSGLVTVVAEGDPLTSAVPQAAVAGGAVAFIALVLLGLADRPPSGGGGGGPLAGWQTWGESVWLMVVAAGTAVYFEYQYPADWLVPFVPLGLSSAVALVVGWIISQRGMTRGPLLQVLSPSQRTVVTDVQAKLNY